VRTPWSTGLPDEPEAKAPEPRWSSSNPLTRPARRDPGLSTPKPAAPYGSRNGFAIAGFTVSLIAMLSNPVFIVGVIGIVLSLLGLARARRYRDEGLPPRFRRYAIAGVALGIAATIAYGVLQYLRLR